VAADNIIIDKLTVGAYTERRSILSNEGATASWAYPTGNYRHGKYFPRGCRGFIDRIGIYCRNVGVADEKITVYISPQPGMAPIYSGDIDVPGNAAPAWRWLLIRRMWNFDSLFIYDVCSGTDVQHAYDTGTPQDSYTSSNAGATWTVTAYRYWFRAEYTGETCGDVPVSGTVNTIEVPALSSYVDSGITIIEPGATVTLATIEGSGHSLWILCWSTFEYMTFEIFVDGVLQCYFAPYDLHAHFCNTGYGIGISLTMWDTAGPNYAFMVTVPFPFKRKIEVKAYNSGDASHGARSYIIAAKL